jgi:dsDNA-specific endonuclease/ATPase MutS2
MNIGDKVRLLHGTEQGVIVAIKGAIIEVEIEEGFSIPVSKSEIVLIAAEEAKRFGQTEKNNSQQILQKEVKSVKGLFFALLPLNDQKFTLHFINNTDWDLPFAIHKVQSQDWFQSIAAGCLQAKTAQRIEDVSLAQLDQWGTYLVQTLFAQKSLFQLQEPLLKKIKFRANQLKNMQEVPVLKKNGYLLQIDREENEIIDVQKIQEQLCEKQSTTQTSTTQISKPASEVDLHIETITKDYQNLSKEEIFAIQLQTFEKALDNAIATGMDEIIFIHGVGNGTLKYEIQKRISKHPHVAYYKDAQKSKFGYGATYVKIK